jgi:hypothetical protein
MVPYLCGVNALYGALDIIGLSHNVESINTTVHQQESPATSIQALADAARAVGAHPIVGTSSSCRYEDLPLGAIVHLVSVAGSSSGHFCLYLGIDTHGRVLLVDPPMDPIAMESTDLCLRWTGHFLAIFKSATEANSFVARSQFDPFRVIEVALAAVAVSLLTYSVIKLMTRKCARYWNRCGALLVVTLCSVGCNSDYSGHALDTVTTSPLQLPTATLNLAYVPPEGASTSVTVKNLSNESVHIRDVTVSCGCTLAQWPKHIGPGATESIEFTIKGEKGIGNRQVVVRIQPNSGAERTLTIEYQTGAYPQFDSPAVVKVNGDDDIGLFATAKLLVRTTRSKQLVSVMAMGANGVGAVFGDPLPTTVSAHQNGQNWVTVKEPGIYALPVVLTGHSALVHSIVDVPITVVIDDEQHSTWVRIKDDRSVSPRVLPARSVIAYRSHYDLAGVRRVFLISGTEDSACNVTSCSELLTTTLEKIGGRQWRLTVTIADGMQLEEHDYPITVVCGKSEIRTLLSFKRIPE